MAKRDERVLLIILGAAPVPRSGSVSLFFKAPLATAHRGPGRAATDPERQVAFQVYSLPPPPQRAHLYLKRVLIPITWWRERKGGQAEGYEGKGTVGWDLSVIDAFVPRWPLLAEKPFREGRIIDRESV